ncbi:hypothetical protein [Microbacterium schleiferi]|uniref:hypothetical protein n=1 Tax=Microbacterium schleiferi TaxID=69362 RepID=UPI001D1764A7|nr:hypothetical protein [Microbacterium schleiferi]MCC4268024.1 hypothetical protein [Microbacterium schleiferi]
MSESEDAWYARLREEYRPEHVRLLLIGESAPSDHGVSSRRNFFYADHLGYDNLYRGVVEAMYDLRALRTKSHEKRPWLRRLQADGVFLIDLVPFPVNAMRSRKERMEVLRANVPGCVERAASLQPVGVIMCSRDVYSFLADPLRAANVPLLHDVPLSFPLGNTRAQFVQGFREARSRLRGSAG